MEQLYLLEENESLTFDIEANEEWKKAVDELGLGGQQKLLSDSGNKSATPFQFMNTSMVRIFEELCPMKVKANTYSKTPIPLKILGVMKLCEQKEYFGILEIWYDDVSVDPILVGVLDNKEKDRYLLARWGDMLRSFDELKEVAKKIWIEKNIAKAKEKIIDTQKALENMENLCVKHFNGEWVFI